MAGYSGTPLSQKLGLKAGCSLGLWSAPQNFRQTLGALPEGVTASDVARGRAPLDVLICFIASRADLARALPQAQQRLHASSGLWLCWLKKSSGVATDVTEQDVRAAGLAAGLVDNKVCAIDDTWSGLRFVVRVQDRAKPAIARSPSGKESAKPPRTAPKVAPKRARSKPR